MVDRRYRRVVMESLICGYQLDNSLTTNIPFLSVLLSIFSIHKEEIVLLVERNTEIWTFLRFPQNKKRNRSFGFEITNVFRRVPVFQTELNNIKENYSPSVFYTIKPSPTI